MKTPLKERFNFKSAAILKEMFPEGSVVESYLLYSAAMELNLAANNRMVVAHTNKYPIYEFWWVARQAPGRIADLSADIFADIEDEMFPLLQEKWFSYTDPVYRSTLFFILNRCSTLGLASCGEIDRSGMTPTALFRLKQLKGENLYVVFDAHSKFSDNINTDLRSDFKFFPVGDYKSNILQQAVEGGHDFSEVSVRDLLGILKDADYKWVVLYKHHPHIFDKFKHYNLIMVDQYGKRTINQEACEDVLIANF